MYKCEKCDKIFDNRYAYIGHCSSHNRGDSYKKGREKTGARRRRLEKSLQKLSECKFCNNLFEKNKIGAHTTNCSLNPDRAKIIEKIKEKSIGRKLSKEAKDKISNKMKLAHMEGRAWNIGKSRWNNKKSYPETFFSKVIENEFLDKEYQSEYPIGIYSADFAWPSKMKIIEIDGDQHQRFEEYRHRDERKDVYLTENGWSILRINYLIRSR